MSQPRPEQGPVQAAVGQNVADASVGDLVGQVAQDVSVLVRQEFDLAKAEVKQEISKAGRAAGMLGGSGFAGYMILLFCSIAAWWGLANVMDQGWAALIVAGIWAVIGVPLYVAGKERAKEVNPKPERTVETVKEVPSTLKETARN